MCTVYEPDLREMNRNELSLNSLSKKSSGFSGVAGDCSLSLHRSQSLRICELCRLAVLAGELRKFVGLFVQIVGEPLLFVGTEFAA